MTSTPCRVRPGHCFEQRDGMRAHIAPDHKLFRLEKGGDGPSDFKGGFCGHIGSVNSTDVICCKNSGHALLPVANECFF